MRKRSDNEQLSVGERERAINVRGDRKLTVHHQSIEEAQVVNGGGYKGKRDSEVLEVGDHRVNENDSNNGRRKINQVTVLKSHDSNKAAPAPSGAREQKKVLKKPLSNDSERRERESDVGHAGRLTHNDFLKHVKGRGYVVKESNISTSKKRPLIEKVGQLKQAGYGRLKDMPFMQARRAMVEDWKDGGGGKIPSKFSFRKIEDLSKYADKINYFDEFCKEVSEPLVECSDELKARELTNDEQAGRNIMFTIRTTLDYHDTRLPILFETWLSTVDPRTVFLVTDGEDSELDDMTENIGEVGRGLVITLKEFSLFYNIYLM